MKRWLSDPKKMFHIQNPKQVIFKHFVSVSLHQQLQSSCVFPRLLVIWSFSRFCFSDSANENSIHQEATFSRDFLRCIQSAPRVGGSLGRPQRNAKEKMVRSREKTGQSDQWQRRVGRYRVAELNGN